ncbi:hypothetical protein AKJ63_01795 [candidate division MSBL1 archaeon SCGC-AAA259D18]|uniref:Phosphatidate cytidylyltransferase n=1 Tax=candidate division MSBL1 archaeon SCGC-AAA259D18 TaxID=1698262 RepID=A0A133UAG5_9EURY|nr:hypothetical protein AKJ63_01795 [candidate division MSBL1 archaeon SCGC-AAA259D18]
MPFKYLRSPVKLSAPRGIKKGEQRVERIEIKRQLFHGLVGILFVAFLGTMKKIGSRFPLNTIYFLPPLSRTLLLTLIGGGTLVLLCKKYEIPGIEWLLKNLERPVTRREFPGKGAFFYALGAFILSLFLEKSIVSASMLILSVGDSSSHIIGKELGRIKHPFSKTKNIEGNIAGALLGGIGASIFVVPAFTFTAAFLSMFVEGIDFRGKAKKILDDNLTVPIISGAVIIVSRTVFS